MMTQNKNLKLVKFILLTSILLYCLILNCNGFVLAASPTPSASPATSPASSPATSPTSSPSTSDGTGTGTISGTQPASLTLQVPILGYTQSKDITDYIANIFQAALFILVPIAIVVIIIAGLQWIFAGGNASKIGEAKKRITGAFLGLLIGLLSYTILSFVGITSLGLTSSGPGYIEPMPIPVLDGEFEQPDTFNEKANPGAPPVAGTMPRIFQCDYRSVKFNCASKTVCSSGCGTVSVTMVLRYYGINISIEQAVAFMTKAGAIGCSISGTSPSGFAAIAKANGLNYSKPAINFDTIKNLVVNKKPIIANVGNRGPGRTCKYTGHGHYIVLSGWDAANNRFIINDPGGRATNRYNGTWDDLTKGCEFKGAYYVGH
jgi:predicted double-glycine peptidase